MAAATAFLASRYGAPSPYDYLSPVVHPTPHPNPQVYDWYKAHGGTAASVTCTDVSQVAIDRLQALQAAAEDKREGLRYMYADATDLRATFDVSTFDVVLDKGCADTFQFRARTSETPRLLSKLFKSVESVLRPGGQLIIITPKRRIKVR